MNELQFSAIAFLESPKQDKVIRLHVSRNTVIAALCSLIFHALLFWASWPMWQQEPLAPPTTIEVKLAPLPVPPPLPPAPTLPEIAEPAPAPTVTTPPARPKPSAKKPREYKPPEVLSQTAPSPLQLPEPVKPEVPSKPDDSKDAPVDMMALVKQNRDKREQAEREAARINAEAIALEKGPSPEEKRQQRIMENLKVGTSGIFEVRRIDARSASFSFKGWKGDYTTARLQYFEVEAGGGQDIRRLMIRRMIVLIREHYQGDFEWISHRLGRAVMKSARVEDSAELEHFLMQEFFGTNYLLQY